MRNQIAESTDTKGIPSDESARKALLAEAGYIDNLEAPNAEPAPLAIRSFEVNETQTSGPMATVTLVDNVGYGTPPTA